MDVGTVFKSDWDNLANSGPMRRALRQWRTESDGLITHHLVNELVRSITSGSRGGRAASTWLLTRAGTDDLARRVLFQTMEPMIKSQARRSWQNGPLGGPRNTDSLAICVTAGWYALGSLAGTHREWPMWALRQQLIKELIPTPDAEYATNPIADSEGIEPLFQTSSGPLEAAVELGRLLRRAAEQGRISHADACLVWSTRVGLTTITHHATKTGMSPSSLRKRRERAEQHLIDACQAA